MTGHFGAAPRQSVCVTLACSARIQPGAQVYFFRGLERQTVCLPCAKRRWGYTPDDVRPPRIDETHEQVKPLGFDSTRSILKSLQAHANRNDPKSRAAGER